MENKAQIHGNVELAAKLRLIVREKCINSFDLYEAQDFIKSYCADTYGFEFYDKSSEAIQYIVENESCNIERNKQPLFDMQKYKEDMRSGVLY